MKPLDHSERFGKGSYALITGGANGIGRAYADHLSKLGFSLILIDKDAEGLEKAKNDISKEDIDVQIIPANFTEVRTEEALTNLIAGVVDKDISILVNNAGLASSREFEKSTAKIVSEVLSLHASCTAGFSSMLYKRFVKRSEETGKKCAIINMASMLSFHPMYQSIIYSMTKGFIRFFTLGLQSESKKNLDIFLVSPGFVSTYMCDFRKEADTISPETCVSNALRALGQLEQTEASMMCRFLSRYLFESIWYLSDEITRAVN